MVRPQITRLQLRLQSEEPDGSECYTCGDCCYLIQNRLCCDIYDHRTGRLIKRDAGGPNQPRYVFCQSCSEIIQEDLK